jgi:hypothetical protein
MFGSFIGRNRSPCVDYQRSSRLVPPVAENEATATAAHEAYPTFTLEISPTYPGGRTPRPKKKSQPPRSPKYAPVASEAAAASVVPDSSRLQQLGQEPATSSTSAESSHYSSCNESSSAGDPISNPSSPSWLSPNPTPSPRRSRSPSPFFDVLGRLTRRLHAGHATHARDHYGSRQRLDMTQAQSSSWDMVYFIAGTSIQIHLDHFYEN